MIRRFLLVGLAFGLCLGWDPLRADADVNTVAARYRAHLLQEAADRATQTAQDDGKNSSPPSTQAPEAPASDAKKDLNAPEENSSPAGAEGQEPAPAESEAPAAEVKIKKNPTVPELVASLKPDGTWDDLNYNRDAKTAVHNGFCGTSQVGRAYTLALAYSDPKNPAHGDPAVAAAFHSSIQYWMKNGFMSKAWFWNEIAIPERMANGCLLMKDQLTSEEMAYVQKILTRKTTNRAGQNGVSAGLVDFVCALVLDKPEVVAQAFQRIFGLIRVPVAEGLQWDNSFHQHHDNLYIGGYGESFAMDEATWLDIGRHTHFVSQITPGQRDLLHNYIVHGVAEVVWKGVMDQTVLGRGTRPQGGEGSGRTAVNIFLTMLEADAENAATYQALIDFNRGTGPNPLLGEKVFFDSDTMVHRRPDFYFSVRGSSTRLKTTESTGSENPHGYYMGDGINCLWRTGKEYSDILAVWDWTRLPGVTSPWDEPVPRKGEGRGGSPFAGGVSDGNNGCFGFELNRNGLAGHKAWFTIDDAVVALGAELSVNRPVDLGTSLNQCLRNGPVTLWHGGKPADFHGGEQHLSDLQAVDHDGIRYLFPEPQPVVVRSQKMTGNFSHIGRYLGDYPDSTANVFQIGIDHGKQPAAASYSYILLPTSTHTKEPVLDAQVAGITIVANTVGQQVIQTKSGLVEAVFYQAGQITLPGHGKVSASAPCVLMMDLHQRPVTAWVADPTHKLASVDIVANGQSQTVTLPKDKPGDTVKVTW